MMRYSKSQRKSPDFEFAKQFSMICSLLPMGTLAQQSVKGSNKSLQLSWPHMRFPLQSSWLSQSPWYSSQGVSGEQQDHMSVSVPVLHLLQYDFVQLCLWWDMALVSTHSLTI